ncbi:hypothetical protein CCACVL1_28041 [Corchorus capsularis]|uniref:Uncharacterized protein n=1 Tax=Corchorus capsularis TaxID=210143 RepID=A0A1R3G7U3_COCAP|nr:hypothetical protein CCACVL1_28041 [Corchorus capsularis]
MSHITTGRSPTVSSSPLPPVDHHQTNNHARKESIDVERELNRTSHVRSQSENIPPSLDNHLSDHQSSGGVTGGSHEISRAKTFDRGSHAELKLPKPRTNKDALSVGERNQLKPILHEASSKAESHQKPSSSNQPNFFSSKRLNSCIIASERTRSFCALLISFLVLVSYIDFPLIGRSQSIIASRPVYIILLTDVTVVLGRLFLNKEGEPEEAAEDEKAGSNLTNRQNWTGAVKLLERGLVAYQTIRALFIDFSIYAAVVICGLSLM